MTLAVTEIPSPHSSVDADELRQVQDDNSRLQDELKVARREAELLRFKLNSFQQMDSSHRSLEKTKLESNAADVSSQVPVECLSESSNDCPHHATASHRALTQPAFPTESNAQPQLKVHPTAPQGRSSSQAKQRSRKGRRDRAAAETPGSTRYWSDSEHQLFLDALKLYGHKDLKSISAHVGTRNMTQVRTHTQKYFMKLMREAKRRSASEETTTNAEQERETSEPTVEPTNDVRSVPEACGVSLLCLVAQETFASG